MENNKMNNEQQPMTFKKKESYISKNKHARGGQGTKYGNKQVIYKGYKFDSLWEMNFYIDALKYQEELGYEVIAHPPRIEVCPAQEHTLADGSKVLYQDTTYSPDFLLIQDGVNFYIDCKSFGTITPTFQDKMKQIYLKYGYYVALVYEKYYKGKETLSNILTNNHRNLLSDPLDRRGCKVKMIPSEE